MGSYATPYLRRAIGTWLTFALPIALTGIVYIAMSLTSGVEIFCLFAFFEGLISAIMVVSVWALRQETTESHLIGRVVGITGSLFKVGMPVMIIFGGMYAEAQSASSVFLLIGFLNISVFVLTLAASRAWAGVSSRHLTKVSRT